MDGGEGSSRRRVRPHPPRDHCALLVVTPRHRRGLALARARVLAAAARPSSYRSSPARPSPGDRERRQGSDRAPPAETPRAAPPAETESRRTAPPAETEPHRTRDRAPHHQKYPHEKPRPARYHSTARGAASNFRPSCETREIGQWCPARERRRPPPNTGKPGLPRDVRRSNSTALMTSSLVKLDCDNLYTDRAPAPSHLRSWARATHTRAPRELVELHELHESDVLRRISRCSKRLTTNTTHCTRQRPTYKYHRHAAKSHQQCLKRALTDSIAPCPGRNCSKQFTQYARDRSVSEASPPFCHVCHA